MTARNAGLTADPLFVGATRPPMRWGVTYSALLFNLVFTMEVFLLTKNLLTSIDRHADSRRERCCCARVMPRFFDLVLLVGPYAICGATRRICASGRRAATARWRWICANGTRRGASAMSSMRASAPFSEAV